MEQESSKKMISGKSFLRVIIILIVFIAGGGGVYYVARNNPSLLGLPKNEKESSTEIDSVVNEVGKLIVLPSDERPSVATVTDIEKVKGQQFFKNAQNGDKILVYTSTKKAILYRPSEKKIIEVGVLNINQQVSTTPALVVTPTGTQPTVTFPVSPTPVQ